MCRASLVMAGVFTTLLMSTPGAAADNGLVVLAAPPVSGGRMRLQVEVLPPALQQELRKGAPPERFHVVVKQAGAQVTVVQRMADSSEGRYTVLAFDQSKSFAPYWPQAFQLARDYADARGAAAQHHTVAVMTFGKNKETHCRESTPPQLEACLDRVKKLGTDQLITRLKFYIQEAVREAALAQPLSQGGSREVIVFTDAGEESAALNVKELAREAREKGVRIHTVVFSGTRTGKGLAQRLDEMSQLAEGSGGRNIQVEDVPAQGAPEVMRSLARALENLYWLDLSFCGVKPGQTSDELAVQVLPAPGSSSGPVAWSGDVAFRQRDDGGDTAACVSPGASGTPAAQTGASTGTTPAQGTTPGTPPVAVGPAGVSGAPAEHHGPPSWLLALLALLILSVLAVLLLRRRQEPAPAPPVAVVPPRAAPAGAAPVPPAPVPPAPAPYVTQFEPAPVASPAWKDPFATLPETRLQLKQGPAGLEPFYRVHKAAFTIGARTGEMDLAVNLPQLSGHHATVQLFKTGNVFIKDENSTNGTFVDGRRLQPGERVQVKPGQSIRLSQQLEFILQQPGLQPSAEAGATGVPLVPAPPAQPVAAEPPAAAPRAKDRTLYSPARGDDE